MECDDYGNVITDDGFYDDDGRWVDMSNYVEDPAMSAAIDAALAGAGAAKKSGKNNVPKGGEIYTEAAAADASGFDIMSWIESRGLSTDGLDEESLRLLMLSLEG